MLPAQAPIRVEVFAAQGASGGAAFVKSANFTAANDAMYHTVATCTVTDPAPAEGKGFEVFVRNGTATVGAVAYSRAGTRILRVFHSGAWANYPVYSPILSADIADATSSETPNTVVKRNINGSADFQTINAIESVNAANASFLSEVGSYSADTPTFTVGSGYVETSTFFRFNDGTYTTTISHSATADRNHQVPDLDGTYALEPSGPYADDAAAATGGVPVGYTYYTAAGIIHRRMA